MDWTLFTIFHSPLLLSQFSVWYSQVESGWAGSTLNMVERSKIDVMINDFSLWNMYIMIDCSKTCNFRVMINKTNWEINILKVWLHLFYLNLVSCCLYWSSKVVKFEKKLVLFSAIFYCYTVTFFCKNRFCKGKAKEKVDKKSCSC